jgi:hypothetical protein
MEPMDCLCAKMMLIAILACWIMTKILGQTHVMKPNGIKLFDAFVRPVMLHHFVTESLVRVILIDA